MGRCGAWSKDGDRSVRRQGRGAGARGADPRDGRHRATPRQRDGSGERRLLRAAAGALSGRHQQRLGRAARDLGQGAGIGLRALAQRAGDGL
jgi:epoxyqueuosine reductase QueG